MTSIHDMYELVDEAAFNACDTSFTKTLRVWSPSEDDNMAYALKDLAPGQHFVVNPTYCAKGMKIHINVTQVREFPIAFNVTFLVLFDMSTLQIDS